ncbi:MAG: EamA family transporter [Desulfofustis sp.]|nr:EamA family transporter [Desulfofustis sp.]
MSLEVMIIVLFSAALHASWNALIRASYNKYHDTVLIVLGAAVWTLFFLPIIPLPAVESWPYLAVSVLIHVVYFTLVALSYRSGQLSLIYPLMRGVAPVLAMIAAALLIKEFPSMGGWIGVLLISCGILALTGDSLRFGTFDVSSTMFALANAGVIVAYTLIDGQGVRLSGYALSYTGWMFLMTAILLLGISFAVHKREMCKSIKTGWHIGLLGGGCSLAAYSLVLWAMTHAPIALVAALRETSVVFAAIIAAFLLKEPFTRLRYASIFTVTIGVIVMKLF